MVNSIRKVQSFGQSIWYDNIRRAMLVSGELGHLVESGIMGVTSNPTIFEKAIAGSKDYDDALLDLVKQKLSPEEIFEILAIDDIRTTADILNPVYQETSGKDGYVSLEVSPSLAYETSDTVFEARRLFTAIDRPNVMIKVPATNEGIQAFEALTTQGINVNVTLIFSISQYQAVAKAYISGLEKRLAAGLRIDTISSVASFFISRIDTVVDAALEDANNQDLMGKIAIASAKVAYDKFGEIFKSERWERLLGDGGRVQRPLWASTSTKNPAYPDTLYVDNLIGPNTVNTVPPATLKAFEDHGQVDLTLETNFNDAEAQLEGLKRLGIDINAVTEKLLEDGVASFAKSYDDLILSIQEKHAQLKGE